jgi:F-type H+-transporting ATPase subunit b
LLALFFWFLLRGRIPALFRNRTDSIQTAIREARAASAEATARLQAVEARLAKLDSEVSGIRAEAEKQAVAEEQRIHAAAEEDKNRVVESAKIEIDAIARNARRELKSYASTLAVDIAAKRIHVDESSDQALVREFVDQLGKDGRQ